MTLPDMDHRAEVVVDLDAIADNVATLRRTVRRRRRTRG